MKISIRKTHFVLIASILIYSSCKLPQVTQAPAIKVLPAGYIQSTDSTNSADINWHLFYTDKTLAALIDTAIKNNPDVSIALQDIEIAKNVIRVRKGELLPTVMAGGAIGIEKVGRYTSQGAGDASAEITPGKVVPENLTDITAGLRTSWEIDIWGKLRTAKKAAVAKYLGSIEGKNFVITNLVAEVANTYYELLSLDNQLDIIKQSIILQQNQLDILKVQKQAAVVTELAVKQFEAQVLNSQSLQYDVAQQIVENENKLNFLLGRYSQKIERNKAAFMAQISNTIQQGIPSQLLKNRPDIRQAELELQATKWETKVAQLSFLPSLNISNTLGIQSFKPSLLYKMPQSLMYSLAGDLAGPIINRNAIIAEFKTANAIQIQAMYEYQKTILDGFTEVNNQLSSINNLQSMYSLKSKEVEILTKAVDIANDLYKYARANYLEVLTAQRDALSAQLEVIEVKKQQFNAVTNVYKALGGGWK